MTGRSTQLIGEGSRRERAEAYPSGSITVEPHGERHEVLVGRISGSPYAESVPDVILTTRCCG